MSMESMIGLVKLQYYMVRGNGEARLALVTIAMALLDQVVKDIKMHKLHRNFLELILAAQMEVTLHVPSVTKPKVVLKILTDLKLRYNPD